MLGITFFCPMVTGQGSQGQAWEPETPPQPTCPDEACKVTREQDGCYIHSLPFTLEGVQPAPVRGTGQGHPGALPAEVERPEQGGSFQNC